MDSHTTLQLETIETIPYQEDFWFLMAESCLRWLPSRRHIRLPALNALLFLLE
jgi:hypothetical protein